MYEMRGYRVDPIQEGPISSMAINFCTKFGLALKKRKKKRYDKYFEMLSEFGITLNVMSDEQWSKETLGLTVGHSDPSNLTISIPNHVYVDACHGEKYALSILLHELGHILLGHKPVLHYSHKLPTKYEDAEWQADMFAEVALEAMGYDSKQLSFEFY